MKWNFLKSIILLSVLALSDCFVPRLESYKQLSDGIDCKERTTEYKNYCDNFNRKNDNFLLEEYPISFKNPYETTFIQNISFCKVIKRNIIITQRIGIFFFCLEEIVGDLEVKKNC